MDERRSDGVPVRISAGILLVLGGIVAPVVAMLVVGPVIGAWAYVDDLSWLSIIVATLATLAIFGIGVALIAWGARMMDGPIGGRP